MLAPVQSLGRIFVVAGLALAAIGVLLYVAPSLPWLGRLPGDLRIERPGLRIYAPITTCLLLSAILSAALGVFSKLR